VGAIRLVLGSASPRRRALLAAAGATFEVDPAEVDESLPAGIAPEDAALQLAERKARAVAARHAGEELVVLAADTIVAVAADAGWELLGKPDDERDARRMLARISGTRHQVVTGVCALHAARGGPCAAFERTWVTMRALAPAEIEAYAASGEWRDKAGGYAIQETAEGFVTALEGGGFDNVVGLPVGLALGLARRAAELAAQRGGRYPSPPSSG
jgi:septum formation protein